jgi:hypothetical protein
MTIKQNTTYSYLRGLGYRCAYMSFIYLCLGQGREGREGRHIGQDRVLDPMASCLDWFDKTAKTAQRHCNVDIYRREANRAQANL